MSDVEYDTDEEVQRKPAKTKKLKRDNEAVASSVVEEYDSADEAYENMLKEPKDEENEFDRQLRLEKEEEQKLKEKQGGEKKRTKIDPDGTEYEWDETAKGWFPKIADKQFFEYQQQNYLAAAVSEEKPQYDR